MRKETEIILIESLARVEGSLQSVKEDITGIKLEDTRQNQLLAEHIAGVKSNMERIDVEREARREALEHHEAASKKRMEHLDERLKIVEFLPNLARNIWKAVKWLGAFAAAGVAIAKFLGLW
tara:strand:+ start:930 stop:1295 length:366 start_codon:yes stop_codon:yes gene_type:complete